MPRSHEESLNEKEPSVLAWLGVDAATRLRPLAFSGEPTLLMGEGGRTHARRQKRL